MTKNHRTAQNRRLIAATQVAACVWVFAVLGTASALASPPETPELELLTRSATVVRVLGFLNPNATNPSEGGTYHFVYRASSTACKGPGEKVSPESPGLSLGGADEAVVEEISGLTQATVYTICLLATNLKGESSVSPAVTVNTALPPESPEAIAATEITGGAAILNGVLNPHREAEPGGYEFRYRLSASECQGEGEEATSPGTAKGHSPEPVSTEATGLLPNSTYTFCLVTFNEAEEEAVGPPQSFTTFAVAPTVDEESVRKIAATEVLLAAQVSPGGQLTTYHVDYGANTPDVSLSGSSAVVGVQERITGLRPATVYKFRFVAKNSSGASEGELMEFTTPSVSSSTSVLPDERGYEMVTPPADGDGEVYPPFTLHELEEASHQIHTGLPVRASEDGNAVGYYAEPPPAGGAGDTGQGGGNAFLATRSQTGWSASDITPPLAEHEAWQGFSSDLSLAVLSDFELPLTPDAPVPCVDLYSRSTSDGTFHALFGSTETPGFCGSPRFAGASADDSSIIFESEARLTPQATEDGKPDNLYDSVDGHDYLVNVLPGGEPDVDATFGGGNGDRTGAISASGSSIVWTDPSSGVLYLRKDPASVGASTVPIVTGGEFWGASRSGSTILFIKNHELFGFDVNTEVTSDLAPGGAVLGVLGLSEDASKVYFVAESVLATNTNSHDDKAVAGQPNVYFSGGGTTRFVASLSRRDNELPLVGASDAQGDWHASLNQRTAEVSPDGRSVEFMSELSLTGYNNKGGCQTQRQEEVGCNEIFVYDSDTQELSCASCNPSGEPPSAGAGLVGVNSSLVGGAFLPTPDKTSKMPPADYQLRTISTDGDRVFFDTAESLVASDSNGAEDVYEWERAGSGTCREPQGCTFLLSGAASNEEAVFVDASANGDDVFFTTRGQLLPQDENEQVDLYDARVDGGFTRSSTECTGTGCQGVPPAPPFFATPASVTFQGAGNFMPAPPTQAASAAQELENALRQCKKELGARRGACEARARQKYSAVSRKLRAALSQCAKKPRRKRAFCEARARNRYKPMAAARHATRRATRRKV